MAEWRHTAVGPADKQSHAAATPIRTGAIARRGEPPPPTVTAMVTAPRPSSSKTTPFQTLGREQRHQAKAGG